MRLRVARQFALSFLRCDRPACPCDSLVSRKTALEACERAALCVIILLYRAGFVAAESANNRHDPERRSAVARRQSMR